MVKLKHILSVCVLLFLQYQVKSISGKEDSLLNQIKIAKEDSSLFNANRDLYYFYYEKQQWSKVKPLAEEMMRIGNKLNNNYYKGVGYRVLGDYYHNIGKNNIALENFLIAITNLEKTNQYLSLSSAYTNLGGLYYDVYGSKQAAVYFKKALAVVKKHKIDDVETITNLNNNLGICAAQDGNYELAKFYFKSALSFWINAHDSLSMAYGYNNLAQLFSNIDQHDSAKVYLNKALFLKLKLGSNAEKAEAYNAVAVNSYSMKDYKGALSYFKKGMVFLDSSSTFSEKRVFYQNLTDCYLKLEDFKSASHIQQKLIEVLLTVGEESIKSDISRVEKGYADSLLNATTQQIKELEISKQTAIIAQEKQQKIFLVAGLLVFLTGGILIYNRYKLTKKQKDIIEQQKQIVEEISVEINHQKELLEEKQKEIIDSINYASRIQNAVSTGITVWESISKDYFVFYQPKDIVSGDFYWAHVTAGNKCIWAAADCTGHGVPGAFMSVLGNTLLNQIVIEQENETAAEILNELRKKVILALDKNEMDQNDGMDIALCVWDKKTNSLEFAGANNSALLVRNKELTELNANKMPIGKYHGNLKSFTATKIQLQKNDVIYLYTDGMADQFGGPLGKKFRYKQLDSILVENSDKEMSELKKILSQNFVNWKGNLGQTDDICVIGIRV